MLETLGYTFAYGAPYILFAFLCYAVIAVCVVVAARRGLSNRGGIGALCIIAAFPIFIAGEVAYDELAVAARKREVGTWARIAAPREPPRALIFVVATDGKQDPDYILNAAETGLFDVFVEESGDRQSHHVVVRESGDCAARRTTNNRFTIAAGFKRCATFEPVDRLPEDAIVVYAQDTLSWASVPRAVPRTGGPFNLGNRTEWAVEVDLRQNGQEQLIAYREAIRKSRLLMSPLFGIRLVLEDQAMTKVSAGQSTSKRADVDGVLYPALGIDLARIAPPDSIDPAGIAAAVTALEKTGDQAGVAALAKLAAANPSRPEIGAALRRAMAQPELAEALRLKPVDCSYPTALASYRNDIARGCAANPDRARKECGVSIYESDWFGYCQAGAGPIWRGHEPTTRVLLLGADSQRAADIVFLGSRIGDYPSPVIEVAIPGDRGMIDLAMVATASIVHVSGAVSCLSRITVISSNAMVAGVPPERVAFVFRFPDSSNITDFGVTIDKLPQPLPDLLGPKPDILVLGEAKDKQDLAQPLHQVNPIRPCPYRESAPALATGADGFVAIDPDSLVGPPYLLPIKASLLAKPDQ